ncbi:MAG TPA: alpha-glucan family phosphorylase [Patescibacteria group bacterium]|nr:alpha-glucan family phosphorylase [Patescibacteria group bacterium]
MADALGMIELSELQKLYTSPAIAYFCAEFAVDEKLPIYAGGLGILAGDMLKQACEDKRPFIGVGLLYHKGYMLQEISKDANVYGPDTIDLSKTDLKLLVRGNTPVTVSVPIHARKVTVKVWVQMTGCVPLLLLDTDIEGNEAQDINLCDQLYYGDREHRFKQEMILGIGGFRVLHELGIPIRLYHLNEGHSALLLFELARSLAPANDLKDYADTLEHLKNVVFTNHTLIPAGNDVFSKDLVISYLASYAMEFPMDPAVFAKYGLIQDSSLFSPTMLALRLATISQAVSKLHQQKALAMWTDHPMVAVTNGVHQKTWQSEEIAKCDCANTDDLWNAHLTRKKILCEMITETTGITWSENDLLIGWARRLANYKQPLILFEDIERLKKIVTGSKVPVRIIFSGKPHAYDEQALQNLHFLLEQVGKFEGSVVYLQNYSIQLAQTLLSGLDVLLNTPIRGFEACGTSGMKASMNGVLLCTTKDGWTDEVDWTDMGFVIEDHHAAVHLYERIEQDIIPLYMDRQRWTAHMQKSITMSVQNYSASRLLSELEAKVYSQIGKV